MTFKDQVQDLAVRIGTEFKTIRTEIANLVGSKASLTTTDKSTIVAAINEVKASLSGAGAVINDATASGTSVYSSTKSTAVANAAASAAAAALIADGSATTATGTTYSANKINAAIAAASAAVKSDLIGGASASLDTFAELEAAMADDETAAAALTTAVGFRVRYDAAQTLDTTQKAQANSNMGSVSLVQLGDPAADFVTAFNAALV